MLTNTLSKIPVKHHKGLKGGLLFAAFMLIDFGFLFFIGFMETEVELSDRIIRLIMAIILLVTGFFCLLVVLKIMQISGRYKKYLAIIKGNDKVFIRQISDITNKNERDVINDLENMISSEYIKDYYIDYQQGLLIDKSFIPERIVKKTIECETCGAHNEVSIGQTNYCKCRSCGNLIILPSDYFYSAPTNSSAEPAVQTSEPTIPPINHGPEPTQEPSNARGWLGLAALATLVLVCFRRKN